MFFKYFKNRKNRKTAQSVVSKIIEDVRSSFPDVFSSATSNEVERIAKFELISVHTIAVLWSLNKFDGVNSLSQAIHDELFYRFDCALREQGVADIRVGPEVRKLASAFHGRLQKYTEAWDKGDDVAFVEGLVRNGLVKTVEEGEKLSESVYIYIQKVNKNSLEEFLKVFSISSND